MHDDSRSASEKPTVRADCMVRVSFEQILKLRTDQQKAFIEGIGKIVAAHATPKAKGLSK